MNNLIPLKDTTEEMIDREQAGEQLDAWCGEAMEPPADGVETVHWPKFSSDPAAAFEAMEWLVNQMRSAHPLRGNFVTLCLDHTIGGYSLGLEAVGFDATGKTMAETVAKAVAKIGLKRSGQ